MTWVTTVFISFGKALLISLSILIGSCFIRFLYRLWIRKMGCYDRSEDLSDSYKYEMDLQPETEMNHMPASQRPAQDAVSEIELPPSPGANTSCPPYNTNSRNPDKAPCDDFSDNFSGIWRHDPTAEGEEMTDAELTSVAAETTTMCSVLTGNDEQLPTMSTSLPEIPRRQSSPLPRFRSPPLSEMQPAPLPELSQSPPLPEFQDYQCYVDPKLRRSLSARQQRDRGTELFLTQYYKNLEQEQENSMPPPP